MSPLRQIFSGAAWTIAARWAIRGLGLVSTLILARLLTPADFGVVAMAMFVVGMIEAFGDTGLTYYIIRHPDPRRAIAALPRAALDEGRLQPGTEPVPIHALDSGDVMPLRLESEHQAGMDRRAVDEDGAGAAFAFETPFLESGQPEFLAQGLTEPHQRVAAQ